jgi:uracil-DNA glycosylase
MTAELSDHPALAAGKTLIEIASAASDCTRCALASTRTQVVFGVGAADARLMFVGEGPGEQEDLQGEPFVGRAGKLLTQLIEGIGLTRDDVYIANVVKCRPPGNRTPRTPEVARCSGWLNRQFELLDPPVIVALGLSAAKWFLGPRTVLARAREEAHPWKGRSLYVTYHPSAAIRFGPNGAPRAALAADLRQVAELVGRRG